MGTIGWKLGLTSGSSVSNSVSKSDLSESIPLESSVYSALMYAYQNGDAAAIAEFNDLEGIFLQGESYIFAYAMNGANLVLPYQPTITGQDRYQIRDAYGVHYTRTMIDIAQRGCGYLYYFYPNPVNNFTSELKLVNILRVNDNWFVGSGNYLSNLSITMDPLVLDELNSGVRTVQGYVHEVGKDAAIEDLRRG